MGDASQSLKEQKTSISPMLSVRNGAKAVEFYKAAFGAGELFRVEAPDEADRARTLAVVDSMTFEQPVYVSNLVVVHAAVTWTGRTSIETEVRIEAEDVLSGDVRHISTAYFVYVATDERGRPTPISAFEPTTHEQKRRWADAERRRTVRLHDPADARV